MVLLLCISGVSVLGWQTKGTGSRPATATFFFPCPWLYWFCARSANGRSPVQIHLGAGGTNFFFHSSHVLGWSRYRIPLLGEHTHTSIYLWPLRRRELENVGFVCHTGSGSLCLLKSRASAVYPACSPHYVNIMPSITQCN